MTDEPADNPPDESQKPKRRRWRWLVAASLLVVLGVPGWWYWPRYDAKFCGKWSLSHVDKMKPYATVELFANGDGEFKDADGSNARSFPWRVDGTAFVMGHGPTGSFSSIMRDVTEPIRSLTGWTPFHPAIEFAMSDVHDTSFTITPPGPRGTKNRIVFHRLPE